MTTPFKSLVPFSPRYVEIEYIAPTGDCCVAASSGSYPEPYVEPEEETQIFFDASEQNMKTEFLFDPTLNGINVYGILPDDTVVLVTFIPRSSIGDVIDITDLVLNAAPTVKGITYTIVSEEVIAD